MSFLGLFDAVLASDATTNLSGQRKRQLLIDTYGEKGFDYAGNAKIDFKIWSHYREAILVNPEPGERRKDALTYTRFLRPTKRVFVPLLKPSDFISG